MTLRRLTGAAVAGLLAATPAAAHAESLTETIAALNAGEITSSALVQELLTRIEAAKDLNAFITVAADRAIEQARAADAARAAGKPLGPLAGVPIVVKDNIAVAGLPVTGGTPALKDHVATTTAPVIAALEKAGAIVLGKTNLHELAFGITSANTAFGAVRTPYDPERFAGGSSGGNGAALAAGLAPAAIGTDTGGSTRIPAALNGVAGFRPTSGRYPATDVIPISATRDTPGPMAPTVADVALLDAVVTGADAGPAAADLTGVRLGVPAAFWADLDPQTEQVAKAGLEALKKAGATLTDVDGGALQSLSQAASFPIVLFEAPRDLSAWLKAHAPNTSLDDVIAGLASPDVQGVFAAMTGEQKIPPEVYAAAVGPGRDALRQAYADLFAAEHLDALVFPTTPLAAQPVATSLETVKLNGADAPTFPTFIRNTDPSSVAGVPALSVPAGVTADGLPVGLEFDGPAWSDRRLLAVGMAAEKALAPTPSPQLFKR